MLFKVFALTLKTAAKPLASRFEGYVMGHPQLRQRVINLAQVRAPYRSSECLCNWGRGQVTQPTNRQSFLGPGHLPMPLF
jgi:hypothetical protein